MTDKDKFFYLCARADRDGACWLPALGSFMYAKSKGYLPIYNKWLARYKRNIFFKPILDNAIYGRNIPEEFEKSITEEVDMTGYAPKGIRQNMALSCIYNKIDNISLFNNLYKKDFLEHITQSDEFINSDEFNQEYTNDKDKVICVHYRWQDVAQFKDFDGTASHQYISNLIDNNSFDNYSSSHKPPGPDQRPMNNQVLNEKINALTKEHPNHKVILVSHPSINQSIDELSKLFNFNFYLFTPNSTNAALWRMMNSDVLIVGKSCFPMIAAYLHLGREVHYSKWGLHAANGLGSKYDQAKNWHSFI